MAWVVVMERLWMLVHAGGAECVVAAALKGRGWATEVVRH